MPLTRWTLVLALCLATGSLAAQEADYRVRGSPDAAVELAIYSDFECPYCRNFALAAMPAVFAEFADPGLIRVRYVFFPLAALHRNAVVTAKAAHCAGRAGRFWGYHDYLYVRQSEWAGTARPDSLWIAYARNLNIDPQAFAACLRAPETLAAVEADLREALSSGATGTPTIVLDGRSLAGLESYAELRAAIRAAVAAAEQ